MQTRILIDNQWVEADDGRTFAVTNPANDEVIARVPDAGAAEARRAIDTAARAFESWRAMTAAQRAGPIQRLGELMLEHRDELAALMTREQGKPLAEAAGEIDYAASFLTWAAGEGPRVLGETIPASRADKRLLVLRQPAGVACAITPWNFPSAMITRKLGPALACGCTMVVKPAEQTPLSALAIGELAIEAGIPPGAVNIVTGDAPTIAGAMLDHDAVRVLSFTGSTAVGKKLIAQSADRVVRLSLELGGHAPLIVFDDADLELTLDEAMAAKFRNAGQTCICPNRFYLHEKIADRFTEQLVERVAALPIGPGTEPGVRIGPLIDDAAVAKVRTHVADAIERGGRVLVGGHTRQLGPGLADRFFEPTVIDGVSPAMRISCEETFGPVIPIARFTDEAEVIARANATRAGLAAYIFTRDASRAIRVSEALEYGIVGLNDGVPSTAQVPFGGYKESGLGREGGHFVMDEYLETKLVSWRISPA